MHLFSNQGSLIDGILLIQLFMICSIIQIQHSCILNKQLGNFAAGVNVILAKRRYFLFSVLNKPGLSEKSPTDCCGLSYFLPLLSNNFFYSSWFFLAFLLCLTNLPLFHGYIIFLLFLFLLQTKPCVSSCGLEHAVIMYQTFSSQTAEGIKT